MTVYNYESITYHVNGMTVINDPKDTKQEGILLHLQSINNNPLTIFLDKRDCAHIAKMTQQGKQYWKRFRLPKMVRQ